MSDLINRKELLKCFCINKNGQRIPEVDCDNIKVTVSIKDVKRIIREQPIAFDTEKVVEQIHDKYCHKCRNILGKQSSEEYCKSVKCEIDALCDIVKKGGVE